MTAQITLIDATVKYTAGPPRDTQRGPRINVVCTLPDGTEQKLWGDPGDAVLTSLKKGQSIKLAYDGRSYKLAADTPPPAPAVPVPEPGREWSDEEKRAVASQIQMQAKLMRYCLEQAKEQCGELVSEGEVFAIAKLLFKLAVQKCI